MKTNQSNEFSDLGLFIIVSIMVICASFLAGYFTYKGTHDPMVVIKTVYAPAKPLNYDEQHLLAYDFMVDNPHVRQELCSHRFLVQPMDSDRGVK
ncbi:MAG: hypothetical protein KGI08_09355 [Thaumarchaeota archaeon]|nr:hypothetical protein [Nitrososphaerota archaeon]